ncbi:MAG: hypothetical protein ACRDRN_15610, partial [Sciscionella sp.]
MAGHAAHGIDRTAALIAVPSPTRLGSALFVAARPKLRLWGRRIPRLTWGYVLFGCGGSGYFSVSGIGVLINSKAR